VGGYSLPGNTSSTSGFGLIATVNGNATIYTDKNVISRTTYHYFDRTINNKIG
jgi:hypothetical protein